VTAAAPTGVGTPPRLLLLSMYALDRQDSGPTVRIRNMRDALAGMTRLEVIAGYRRARFAQLARYAMSGRLRRLDGIYVESSTFLPSPADVAFLALARSLGIPVLTFLRDAYQLFPDYYAASSLKRRVARGLFMPAFRALMAASTRLAFPSRGLAAVFGHGHDGLLLPPGASPPVDIPRRPDANQLLYVGGLALPAFGGESLIAAVQQAREAGHDVELTVVCRPGEEPPGGRPHWLHVEQGSGARIHELLPRTIATVIPRRRTAYNDLAVPVKLMEYLTYGRPLLVTDCLEQARIVEETGSGLVVPDSAEGIASGIEQLFDASAARLDELSEAARRAAVANSWHARAQEVLSMLSLDA
jgi:glycosyltransferase involved in cell wall biosynthesis